jgi:hypothetical protein
MHVYVRGAIQGMGVRRAKSAWGVGFVKQSQPLRAGTIPSGDI